MDELFKRAEALLDTERTKAFDESEKLLFPKPKYVIPPVEMLQHYVRTRYLAEVMVSHLKLAGMPECAAGDLDEKIRADVAAMFDGFRRSQAGRN